MKTTTIILPSLVFILLPAWAGMDVKIVDFPARFSPENSEPVEALVLGKNIDDPSSKDRVDPPSKWRKISVGYKFLDMQPSYNHQFYAYRNPGSLYEICRIQPVSYSGKGTDKCLRYEGFCKVTVGPNNAYMELHTRETANYPPTIKCRD